MLNQKKKLFKKVIKLAKGCWNWQP